MRCPWCGEWERVESYTQLQIPPNFPKQCAPIYKHGTEWGCKKLFALAVPK